MTPEEYVDYFQALDPWDRARYIMGALDLLPVGTVLDTYPKVRRDGMCWEDRQNVTRRRRDGSTYESVSNVAFDSWSLGLGVATQWGRAANPETARAIMNAAYQALAAAGELLETRSA